MDVKIAVVLALALVANQCRLGASGRAALHCGKGSHKTVYGQEKSLVSAVSTKDITCKYKIRVPRGYHVQVTVTEMNLDPCCDRFVVYDGSKAPFRWQSDNIISTSLGSVEAGEAVTFPTPTVAMKYKSNPTSNFALQYSAVIPEDGNCGFDGIAVKRSRILRSPGYPKSKSPVGLNCVWNIKANKGSVYLDIRGLRLKNGVDFLEIYEGEKQLGRHTGWTRKNLNYISTGNSLQLRYQTNAATSRGFRAAYKEITVNKTVVATPRPGGIRCYQRYKTTGIGDVVSASHAEITCPPSHLCGQTHVIATSKNLGNSQIISQTGGCAPVELCKSGPCNDLPPMEGMTITSCEASCCDTDLCNPAPREPPPTATVGDLQCYTLLNSRLMIMGRPGKTIIDNESSKICPTNSKCSKIVAVASSEVGGSEIEVVTTFGDCIPDLACDYLDCSSIPSSVPGVTIKSCEASCCDSDLCNGLETLSTPTPPSLSVPVRTSPPSAGTVEKCYSVLTSGSMGMNFLDSKSEKVCPPQSKCSHIVATALSTVGNVQVEVTTTYGDCIPALACDYLNCDSIPSSTPGVKITSCQATCCDRNLCNGAGTAGSPRPPTSVAIGSTPPSGTGLRCYDIMSSKGMGQTFLDQKSEVVCEAESKCLLMTSVATHTSMPGLEITTTHGRCVPAIACDYITCDSMPASQPNVTVRSCKASCCDTDLCNKADVAAEPSTSSLAPSGPITCYSSVKMLSNGKALLSQKDKMSCPVGSVCMLMNAGMKMGYTKVEGIQGSCIQAASCGPQYCDVLDTIPGMPPGAKIDSCKVSCCNTSLCNDS